MFTAASPAIPSFGDQAYKKPVANATLAALPANTRTGNTLTASANGPLGAIDGVTNTPGDRILVRNEATGANNGIYVLVSAGDGTHPWSMVRSPDTDTAAEAVQGAMVYVLNGTVNLRLTFVAVATWTLNVTNPDFRAVYIPPGDPVQVLSSTLAGTPVLSIHGRTGSGEPTLQTSIQGDAGIRAKLGGASTGLQLGDGTGGGVFRLWWPAANIAQLDDSGGGLNVGLVGKPPLVTVYATNNTWTPSAGLDHIVVECVGGGGQGGGSAATAAAQGSIGGGGGGGGYARKLIRQALLSGNYTVTVGAGGSTGGAGAAGQNGAASSFAGANIATVTGGGGSGGGTSAAAGGTGVLGGGGAGGVASNGDANVNGSGGATGAVVAGTPVKGGVGGGNPLGPASADVTGINQAGAAGTQYGGGGQGAITSGAAGPARAGGAGFAGIVIVTEYYGP